MYSKLPSDSSENIASFLDNKSLTYWSSSSRSFSGLFQPKVDGRKMLSHVVRGEHDMVRTLLTKNIDLLYARDCITDCSGRNFESVSPFEYALWALDKHMWDTMLSCIPKNERGNAVVTQLKAQYEAFKIDEKAAEEKAETPQVKGVTYSLDGKLTTERNFNFKETIIKALEAQNSTEHQTRDAIYRQWIDSVGGAQRLLPMHVVNEYCAQYSFEWTPDFTNNLEGERTFYNFVSQRKEDWFAGDSKLGIDFAIMKGHWTQSIAFGSSIENIDPWVFAWMDLHAMKSLFIARTQDFRDLAAQLEQSRTADNQPLTFHM